MPKVLDACNRQSHACRPWLFQRKVDHTNKLGDKDNKKYPVGLIFLFDPPLPAYRIREGSYNIERFYSVAQNGDDTPDQIRYPFRIRRSLVRGKP